MISTMKPGSIARGKVEGKDGADPINPKYGVFFRFGDDSLGLARYANIDGRMVGRERNKVKPKEARKAFPQGARVSVFLTGAGERRDGYDAWELAIRYDDQPKS